MIGSIDDFRELIRTKNSTSNDVKPMPETVSYKSILNRSQELVLFTGIHAMTEH